MTLDTTKPFRLGFLTHVHGAGRAPAEVYRDLITVFQAAEDLGFDGGWVAQHHLRSDYGRLPSPPVLLAAVAERTTHLQLGTAVTVLPLEHPLRLAEDWSVLEALAGPRLQLGVGTGGANIDAFAAFGAVAPADRHADFDDRLGVLRDALLGQPLGASSLVAQPAAPDLADRLWQSTSDPGRARAAARAGDGLLLGTAVHDPLTEQKPLADAYLDEWSRSQTPGSPRPRIAITRAVFPARNRHAAARDLEPALAIHRQGFAKHGYTELLDLSTEDYLARINVHYGSVDDVVESIQADPALLGYADWFLPVVQHEVSSVAEDIRRLEIIANEIAPALGWSASGGRGRGAAA